MYNSFMAMLQDLVSEFGLECSLLAPVAYCPLPYFKNLGTIAVFVGADFVFSVWKTLAALSKEWHGMDFFTAPMGLARDCLWLPNTSRLNVDYLFSLSHVGLFFCLWFSASQCRLAQELPEEVRRKLNRVRKDPR